MVPNRIENRLKYCKTLPTTDDGYIIVSVHGDANDALVGDILTSINGRSVGMKQTDDAFGDCTWFLDEGNTVEIIVHRYDLDTDSHELLCFQHTLKYLPTALDIATSDPQFMFLTALFISGAAILSTMYTATVIGGIVWDKHDYCTDIHMIKPDKYSPSTILEDPEYDPLIHDRDSYNAKDYYIRRLSPREKAVQKNPNAIYEIMQDCQLSCMYKGKTEYITCPAGRVFDGDTLMRLLNIENDGIGWVFHDWLYFSHSFDRCADGTQTLIPRWVADELMYDIIHIDGYSNYARFTKHYDIFISSILNTAWNFITKRVAHYNVYVHV